MDRGGSTSALERSGVRRTLQRDHFRRGLMNSRIAFGLAALSLALPVLAAPLQGRALTFEQRVAAQKALEQVYWSHRIWPETNPGPKPPLSAVLPDEAIRAKVATYLEE